MRRVDVERVGVRQFAGATWTWHWWPRAGAFPSGATTTMPLYLVRWPGLEASIVRANDEAHLGELLDEVASPGDATWSEYDGPLWVDVSLGLELERGGDEWNVRGAKTAATEPWLGAKVQTAESETADEMLEAVLAGAFPNLAAVVREADEEQLDPKKVRAAALRDRAEHGASGVRAPVQGGKPGGSQR